jgi:hypothetical protein
MTNTSLEFPCGIIIHQSDQWRQEFHIERRVGFHDSVRRVVVGGGQQCASTVHPAVEPTLERCLDSPAGGWRLSPPPA